MILERIRLKPFDFLYDAAKAHFEETGVMVKSMIIPQETLIELKRDTRTVPSCFSFLAYVHGILVVGARNEEPTLIDDLRTRTPLL